ncbi:hypothetical protein AAKU64_000669 [Undibacterium sp. GrIS 1.8]
MEEIDVTSNGNKNTLGNNLRNSLILFLLGTVSTLVTATGIQYSNLSGTSSVWGATPYDNEQSAQERHDTHYYMYIKGSSAQDLYNTMKVKSSQEECHGEGSRTKRIQNISCTKLAKSKGYECSFAINVAIQKIENADTCPH